MKINCYYVTSKVIWRHADSYRHDRRADKISHRHDCRTDRILIGPASAYYVWSEPKKIMLKKSLKGHLSIKLMAGSEHNYHTKCFIGHQRRPLVDDLRKPFDWLNAPENVDYCRLAAIVAVPTSPLSLFVKNWRKRYYIWRNRIKTKQLHTADKLDCFNQSDIYCFNRHYAHIVVKIKSWQCFPETWQNGWSKTNASNREHEQWRGYGNESRL